MNRLELKALMAATIAAGRRASEGSADMARQRRDLMAQYAAQDAEAVLRAIEDRSILGDNQPVAYIPCTVPPHPSGAPDPAKRTPEGINADYVCFGGMLLESLRNVLIERTDGDDGYIVRDCLGRYPRVLYTAYVGPKGASVYRAIPDDKGHDIHDEKPIIEKADLQRALDAVLADHRGIDPDVYED